MSALSDAVLVRVKIALGIVGTAQDTELTGYINQAISEVGAYLGRDLLPATYTEAFFNVTGAIILTHYPVASITTVVANGDTIDPAGYQLALATGMLWRKSGNCLKFWTHCESVEITYVGANFVAPFPEWLLFALTETSLGIETAVGGGAYTSDARKESVAGVYSIDFGASASESYSNYGRIPGRAVEVLGPYRFMGAVYNG